MFNRLARLWGRKAGGEQDAATPVGGQIDQEARQGDKDALDRSLERYRQQSAERERQWKEAQLKEIEAQSGPAATWPRLSETLDGPKHPRFCQSCGAERPPEAPDEATPATGDELGAAPDDANDSFRRVKAELEPPPGVYGWQEHDSRDEPEPIAVMLCTTCSKRLSLGTLSVRGYGALCVVVASYREAANAPLGWCPSRSMERRGDRMRAEDRDTDRAKRHLGRGERGARVPAPTPDADRWPQVRAYLVEGRGIPRGMVDTLHERGDIYADARGNAVFVRRDEERAIVGASLRGTAPGSEFQGLALGTRRDEGHFSFTLTLGKPSPHDTPQYHLVESPIDALSRAVLARQAGETGPHVFISTDGQGELPRRQIDEALANRGLVRCGFDNDQGGAALWAQVKEAYPRAEAIERERPPAGAKDWNDALRAAQTQEWGREEARAPARDADYHDR